MIQFAKPQIPSGLLHDMLQVTPGGSHDNENGGQWKPTLNPATVKFKGVVLPLSNEDLEYLPEGTITKNSQKLYTNGKRVEVGATFTDTFDGVTYTITTELTHGPLHPMKRYLVETKGGASPK
jgi:hypothetical protein